MTPDPISLILVDKIFHPIKITESVLIIKHPRLDMWVKLKNRRMIRRSPFYFKPDLPPRSQTSLRGRSEEGFEKTSEIWQISEVWLIALLENYVGLRIRKPNPLRWTQRGEMSKITARVFGSVQIGWPC